MREILFRGKYSKKSPDWIEGSFHRDEDTNICEIAYRYYKKENETKAGIWVYGVVDPETVGQYTGLKDKNGKKIFEGDIVCHDFGEKQIGKQYAIVKWSEKYASFQLNPIDDWMFCNLSDVKVVGNIHDKKLEDFENG